MRCIRIIFDGGMRDEGKIMGTGARFEAARHFSHTKPDWMHFCPISCRVGEDGSSDVDEIFDFGISLCT